MQLQQRKRPRSIVHLFRGSDPSPLLWSVTDDVQQAEGIELVAPIHRSLLGESSAPDAAMLRQVSARVHRLPADDAPGALLWLALVWALPEQSAMQDEEVWWGLVDRAGELAGGVSMGLDVDPWTYQLRHVELPLTLAYQFPELGVCRQLAAPAAASFTRSVHELLDGDGWPQARLLSLFRPLLACWVRSLVIARALGLDALVGDEAIKLDWFVRQSLALARSDGSQLLAQGAAGAWNPQLFDAVRRITKDKDDRRIARAVLPGQNKRRASGTSLPKEIGSVSEWAEVAVLRAQWDRRGPRLAVVFPRGELQFELAASRSLLVGDRPPQVSSGQQAASLADAWEVACWHSDKDVEYLELTTDLTGGTALQRQFLLARRDQFLFMADALLPPTQGELRYEWTMRAAEGINLLPETETNEVYLTADKIRALVLPLAIGEWKQPGGGARWLSESGELTLQLSSSGRALYVPWFVDLKAGRSRKPRTWRRLTVAEMLHAVPTDVAAAYRVQVGRDQWVFYRSLCQPSNRTFLGQNVSCEFFAGRFKSDGDVKELLAIE